MKEREKDGDGGGKGAGVLRGNPGFQHISIFPLFSTLKYKINHKSTFIKNI